MRSLDPPHSTDAVDLAEQFAALKRWSVAIHDFSERIEAIEEAYREVPGTLGEISNE
jgi:hypothetical protein